MQRNGSLPISFRVWRALAAGVLLSAASLYMPAAASEPAAATTAKQPSVSKPRWSDLTPEQQHALAPLADEWDQLEATRKNKWLAIGNKFSSMTPDEQQRVHARMRDWVTLTPDQRRVARESHARASKLGTDRKSARWEQYQQLPEEEKKKLAAGAASKNPVATLPPPASQGKNTIPPIKSAPKSVLERSAIPQPTAPSSQPSN